MDRREAAEHLRFFGDLGVAGVSRDPAWRARASGQGAGPAPVVASETEGEPDAADDERSRDLMRDSTQHESGMSLTDAAAALQAVREDIGDCTRCKLHMLGRNKIVFGTGYPRAELMFVGEAPGADEDQQGEPFVGRAGQLLTKIIEAIGLTREQVYIANVIKCRPPGNRNPEPDEIATCEPFLFRQIDIIRPRIIVALGTHAAHALLKTDAPISRIRGVVHDYRGGSKLIPTFHPAYLLRSPDRKRDVWEDMKKVRALLDSRDSGD
jgi:uracil-DNA glycosylase family 4